MFYTGPETTKSPPVNPSYLTLVVTNTYDNTSKDYPPLFGVKKDRQMLKEAFTTPPFHHVDMVDCNAVDLKERVRNAIRAAKNKYDGLVVIFSGHGEKSTDEQFIISNDGERIEHLHEFCIDLCVNSFDSINGSGLYLPKVFMFDCCRCDPTKGRKNDINTYIAYGTSDDAVANCPTKGSTWMRYVCEAMKDRKNGDTLVNIIKRAKEKMGEDNVKQVPSENTMYYCPGKNPIYI